MSETTSESGAAPGAAEAFTALLPDVGYAVEIEPHFRFRYVSPSIEDVLGYSPDLLYSDPHVGLRLLDPRDGAALQVAASAASGTTVEFTVRWHEKGGDAVWTHHRCHKVVEADGTMVLYGVARNVTGEVEAVQRLAEAEEQARLVLDNASDVLIRYAPDGTVLWASPSLRTAFGFDPDEVVGTRLHLAVPEQRDELLRISMEAITANRDTAQARMKVACADGSMRWADATSQIRPWQRTAPSSFAVTSMHDVTAEVVAEDGTRRFRAAVPPAGGERLRHGLPGLERRRHRVGVLLVHGHAGLGAIRDGGAPGVRVPASG